ncbi:MAG: dihydroorotase [Flavobacterium sp.]|nr:dihydroorotase [Candidatus Neoflavobacterium equi]
MNVIFKNATIVDATQEFHNKKVDLKIENGIITQIETQISSAAGFEEVSLENLHISQGWFDSSVSFGEPGYEDRETIANGLRTAASSGFTAVALQPNALPVVDNQAGVTFVKSRAAGAVTSLYPIGALTKNSEGKDLAEMYDMQRAGAVAFGDYQKSLSNANLLKIGLQYAQDFAGLVVAFCQDQNIKGNGVVHEGIVSTTLGLKGIAPLAEELEVARNLYLLKYTGGKLHLPTISTAKSVELIREAKAAGLDVTCSVAVHQLVLTDAVLVDFDTRYKVMPPLRDEAHRAALIAAVADGTIDFVTSDHNPLDIEHKKMEFDGAKYGTIGLESAFGALMQVFDLETVIRVLTAGKARFSVAAAPIQVGSPASLTLFNPEGNAIFSKFDVLSKSKNSAFFGVELKGSAYGVYNNNQMLLK